MRKKPVEDAAVAAAAPHGAPHMPARGAANAMLRD